MDENNIVSTSAALELYHKGVIIKETTSMHSGNKTYTQNKCTDFDICFNAVMGLFLLAHSKFVYPDTVSGYGQTGLNLFNLLKKFPDQRLLP